MTRHRYLSPSARISVPSSPAEERYSGQGDRGTKGRGNGVVEVIAVFDGLSVNFAEAIRIP